ncbi:MAG: type I DNA topoisomerase [candidate division SR1 bacterium]|nr:type I DNA topoisomerase [candidate division SR1 bacterium]
MLIIVESPAKAKTISKIVGNKYIVKASVGHIRRISNDKKTKDNRRLEINGIDIDNHFLPIYEIDPKKKDVVKELIKLAKQSKDGVLFATDADREGEAISWHLSEILGIKDKSLVQRLEFHEITPKAINEALKNPRLLNTTLVKAQQARQVLDKLVGYKLSPVLWSTMNNYKLSAGRVQSPALRIICEREQEIISFISTEFWEISGMFDVKQIAKAVEKWALWENKNEREETSIYHKLIIKASKFKGIKIPKVIDNKQELLSLVEGLNVNTLFTIIEVKNSTEINKTKPPFITSTLQQAASSKLGFTPKITMQLAQKLYEGVDIDGSPTALITYMRTDSVNLSQDSIDSARAFISSKYPECLPDNKKHYKSKSKNSQEAHEAIRPTNPQLVPQKLIGKLEPKMLKLYTLIWKQMIGSQMTDEIKERVNFDLENSQKDLFSGSFAWTIHPGFKILSDEKLLTSNTLNIKKNETLYLQELEYLQKFTQPPYRFSPASLIKRLEELGIGRPSTYATIISTLHDREYVEDKAQTLIPTTLGMKINILLVENFTEVTGAELTARMEDNLDDISRGEKEYEDVLQNFWGDFKKQVEAKIPTLKEDRAKYTSSESDVEDPKFGDKMVLKVGRFGEYYQNPNHPEIMYPKNFRELETAEKEAHLQYDNQAKGQFCVECKKELVVRVSKSSLNTYIACAEYKVGNKHTVTSVNFGPCPQCSEQGRKAKKSGVLIKKSYKGRSYISCNLDKKICGYTEKTSK